MKIERIEPHRPQPEGPDGALSWTKKGGQQDRPPRKQRQATVRLPKQMGAAEDQSALCVVLPKDTEEEQEKGTDTAAPLQSRQGRHPHATSTAALLGSFFFLCCLLLCHPNDSRAHPTIDRLDNVRLRGRGGGGGDDQKERGKKRKKDRTDIEEKCRRAPPLDKGKNTHT